MAVVGLEITSRRPLADGATFGDVGAYERIDGIVRFAVDPEHAANRAIVDLDKAERDADGRVPSGPTSACSSRPTRRGGTVGCCSRC